MFKKIAASCLLWSLSFCSENSQNVLNYVTHIRYIKNIIFAYLSNDYEHLKDTIVCKTGEEFNSIIF